jgi:hypothetical protein
MASAVWCSATGTHCDWDTEPHSLLDKLSSGAFAGATELRLKGCGLTEVPDAVFELAPTLEV